MRGNPQALFGKRPTEKDPAKGTSPAVDFTTATAWWSSGSLRRNSMSEAVAVDFSMVPGCGGVDDGDDREGRG